MPVHQTAELAESPGVGRLRGEGGASGEFTGRVGTEMSESRHSGTTVPGQYLQYRPTAAETAEDGTTDRTAEFLRDAEM